VLPIFRIPYKQKKKSKIQKKLEENKKIYIIEKNVLECLGNCRRLVEKNKLYKIEKFNSVFSTDEIYKENSI
jgi:hypothetical protein